MRTLARALARGWARATIIALAAGLLAAPAQAKLYKWVDENGNVTYSERKPPQGGADREVEEIKLRPSTISDEDARERLDVLTGRAAGARKKRDEQESQVTAAQEREQRIAKNCEIARENLEILQTNARVKTQAEDGSSYYLGEDQISARLEQARTNIDRYCN